MREIKFRGKSTMEIEEMDKIGLEHDNGWVHGNLVMYGNQPYIVGDFIEVDEEYTINEWWSPVYENSMGQSTGLKDMEGTEIYEGDIILVNHLTVENITTYSAIVERDKARFAERKINNNIGLDYSHISPHGIIGPFNTLSTFGKQVEVIGNIYEHKHLLEAE